MNHGSLFSGIGGFDLAASWLGWTNVFQVEKDEFCQRVLNKHFPNTKRYGDIYEFDGKEYRGTIDVLTGGFPCQPFSVAGQQRGTDDDRYLWPEMLRAIRQIKPRWIVGENVAGIIKLALDQVISDLEAEGYTTETFVIPACAVNAPHRRDRVWIVAHAKSAGRRRKQEKIRGAERRPVDGLLSEPINADSDASDTNSKGCIRRCGRGDSNRDGIHAGVEERQDPRSATARCYEDASNTEEPRLEGRDPARASGSDGWASEQPLSRFWDNEGRPDWNASWLEVATRLCRVDDGVPRRVDRLRSLGNAIVPQVAYEIFKAIEETERR